jgi:hypothetical protein
MQQTQLNPFSWSESVLFCTGLHSTTTLCAFLALASALARALVRAIFGNVTPALALKALGPLATAFARLWLAVFPRAVFVALVVPTTVAFGLPILFAPLALLAVLWLSTETRACTHTPTPRTLQATIPLRCPTAYHAEPLLCPDMTC